MNSENNKTPDRYRLLLNFSDKIDLRKSDKRNTISLSRHEQVCLMRLRFERYFSHHRAM